MVIAKGDNSAGGKPVDWGLLTQVKDMFETADPMPRDLPERIHFALALRDLEAELARFADTGEEPAAAARGAEESWTVTFDSDSLTIMIRVDANPDGSARVDGWLAPPQPHQVEIRRADCSVSVAADNLGRFVFDSVPRGTARLIVHPVRPGSGEDAERGSFAASKSVMTPALTLLPRSRR
ncbi:MAG TPA: hypothetical protein VK817_05215 [Trebonia sp.]|jgi:hypothetical protein|nr:hypothetical protein [Trebonia sp.]